MKKSFLLAAVLTTLTTLAMFAYAGDQIRVDLTIKKGDQVISRAAASVRSGNFLPIAATRKISYRAQAFTENGETKFVLDEANVGLVGSISPRVKNDGQVAADVVIDFSELLEMTDLQSGGMTIQVPSIQSEHFVQNMTFGEAPVTVESNGYTVEISARKI